MVAGLLPGMLARTAATAHATAAVRPRRRWSASCLHPVTTPSVIAPAWEPPLMDMLPPHGSPAAIQTAR
jgi:hypothetical protein